jgi:pre-rRNA-processing protein TSR3
VPLHIIHLSQDDPKKCTARKLQKRGLAIIHDSMRRLPRRGFLLDPLAGEILGPDDLVEINRGGAIVGLDCSWKKCDVSFDDVKAKSPMLKPRTLPLVLAANQVSWGKPGRLSTVEALAVCLILLNKWEQAREILSPFKFGEQFLQLNKEPLEAYANASTNAELIDLQWEFFDKPDE